MNRSILRATFVRALFCATLLTAVACTPVRVLTHTVSQNEARVPAGHYDLDPDHCSITFDIDHFKYSRFTMRFDRKQGQLDWNEGGLDRSSATITIDAASIDTNVPLLDKMVKSASMLDVSRYPEVRFASTRFERPGAYNP
jgi:polyisoprenoid-binding protein YceI